MNYISRAEVCSYSKRVRKLKKEKKMKIKLESGRTGFIALPSRSSEAKDEKVRHDL